MFIAAMTLLYILIGFIFYVLMSACAKSIGDNELGIIFLVLLSGLLLYVLLFLWLL